MKINETARIIEAVAWGIIEKQFAHNAETAILEKWTPQARSLILDFALFISENPTINRLVALIRAAGRFEYFKNLKVKEFVEGTLDESAKVIVLMARDFEKKQELMYGFIDQHQDS